MPEVLDLRFTPELREEILSFLAGITEYEPTLSLMKSTHADDPEEAWHYGAYAPRNIEVLAPEFGRLGHPLLYSADDLVVAIPQVHLLAELRGKTLAQGPGRLVLMDREPRV